MLVELGRISEAKLAFEELVSAEPGNVLALNNLGACLKELGDREGAIKSVQRALAINPSLPHALSLLHELTEGR